MNRTETLTKLKDLVEDVSWFQLDGDIEDFIDEDDTIVFATRDNGCAGDEHYGQEDYDEGERMLSLVMEKYGHLVESYELTTFDEWVNLEIELK